MDLVSIARKAVVELEEAIEVLHDGGYYIAEGVLKRRLQEYQKELSETTEGANEA